MRGIAAIGVALFHFSGPFDAGLPLVFRSYGWLGVDMFFVISGFVIPLSLYGKDYQLRDFPMFIMRRLVRLEPPYLASIGLGLILWLASSVTPGFRGTDPSYSLPQVLGHLFYAIPLTSYAWLSPVYWSLAYEFIFYILVGLTFAFLVKKGIEFTILTTAIIASGCFYLEGKIDVRVLEFVVGVTLMRLYVAQEEILRIGAWLAIGIMLVFYFGGTAIGAAVLMAAGAILLFHRVQLGMWAYTIGGISYSFYLTHVLIGGRVINLGARFGDGQLYACCLIAIALLLSLAAAAVFSRLIERPSTEASRRIRYRLQAQSL
jgi:peptidoglycan/LPS O-acetylase OafA/YrhL